MLSKENKKPRATGKTKACVISNPKQVNKQAAPNETVKQESDTSNNEQFTTFEVKPNGKQTGDQMRPFEFGDASLDISNDAYVSPSVFKNKLVSPDAVTDNAISRKLTPNSSFVTAHVTALAQAMSCDRSPAGN